MQKKDVYLTKDGANIVKSIKWKKVFLEKMQGKRAKR